MRTKNGISGVNGLPWARADVSRSWPLFISTFLTASEMPTTAANSGQVLWCLPIYWTRLTDLTAPGLNTQSEPRLALVCATRLVICLGYWACDGAGPTEWTALWNMTWDRAAHSTPPNLTLKLCSWKTLRERDAGIYIQPRSTSGIIQVLGLRFLSSNISHCLLLPCCNSTRIWLLLVAYAAFHQDPPQKKPVHP